MSCDDPVEAAARKQRVQYTNENGITKEAVERILAHSQHQLLVVEHHNPEDNNPATPSSTRRGLQYNYLLRPNKTAHTPLEN